MAQDRQPEPLTLPDAGCDEARVPGWIRAAWDLEPGARMHLLCHSENRTFQIDRPGADPRVLRCYRPHHRTDRQIASELAWIAALRAARTVDTPEIIAGTNGQGLQHGPSVQGVRIQAVMFSRVGEHTPDPDSTATDLPELFHRLGGLGARMHRQQQAWTRPAGFGRLAWVPEQVLGQDPLWGDWRAAPGLGEAERRILEQAEAWVTRRLARLPREDNAYGLIHADLRCANLRTDAARRLWVIDFDDCGFGWYLFDFAASASFLELDPRFGQLQTAWLAGYRRHAPLPPDAEDRLAEMVLLRRLALLGWVAANARVDFVQRVLGGFAADTARLAAQTLEAGTPD